MKRTSASVRFSLALAFGLAAWATAQNMTPHLPNGQAAVAYQLKIVPTKMDQGNVSLEITPDSWIARGFDLKSLIAQIYDFDPRRIDFTDPGLADARYDVTLTTPTEMDPDVLQNLAVEAVTKKLGLSIVHESRALDVYVLTAPGGPGSAMHRHFAEAGADEPEQFKFEARHCAGIASGGGIAASGGTMREFTRQLEPDLDRLFIDETHLTGGYDFTVGGYANQETLFRLLHDQLDLVVVPARRIVAMVVVRTTGDTRAGHQAGS